MVVAVVVIVVVGGMIIAVGARNSVFCCCCCCCCCGYGCGGVGSLVQIVHTHIGGVQHHHETQSRELHRAVVGPDHRESNVHETMTTCGMMGSLLWLL